MAFDLTAETTELVESSLKGDGEDSREQAGDEGVREVTNV